MICEVDLRNAIVKELSDVLVLSPKDAIAEGRDPLLLARVVLISSDIVLVRWSKIDFSLLELTEKHVQMSVLQLLLSILVEVLK